MSKSIGLHNFICAKKL